MMSKPHTQNGSRLYANAALQSSSPNPLNKVSLSNLQEAQCKLSEMVQTMDLGKCTEKSMHIFIYFTNKQSGGLMCKATMLIQKKSQNVFPYLGYLILLIDWLTAQQAHLQVDGYQLVAAPFLKPVFCKMLMSHKSLVQNQIGMGCFMWQ